MFYSITPVYIITSLLPLFLHGVYIGVLVSMYWSLEYTVNFNKNKQKLTFNKTSNFCFMGVHTLCHTITPSSMDNTNNEISSLLSPQA